MHRHHRWYEAKGSVVRKELDKMLLGEYLSFFWQQWVRGELGGMGKRFKKMLPNILQGKTRDKKRHWKKTPLENPTKKPALTETKSVSL